MKYSHGEIKGMGYSGGKPSKVTGGTKPGYGVGHMGKPTVGVGGEKGSSGKGVGAGKSKKSKAKKSYSQDALNRAVNMTANPKTKQINIKLGDKY